jgi:hypothetical protein
MIVICSNNKVHSTYNNDQLEKVLPAVSDETIYSGIYIVPEDFNPYIQVPSGGMLGGTSQEAVDETTVLNASVEIIRSKINLSAAKSAKQKVINTEREAQLVMDVSVHDRQWQADVSSQALLGQAITLASAGLPLPSVWRDVDNNDMQITSLADLLAIAGAIAVQTEAAYATSWARKAALEAATTIEEVEAV